MALHASEDNVAVTVDELHRTMIRQMAAVFAPRYRSKADLARHEDVARQVCDVLSAITVEPLAEDTWSTLMMVIFEATEVMTRSDASVALHKKLLNALFTVVLRSARCDLASWRLLAQLYPTWCGRTDDAVLAWSSTLVYLTARLKAVLFGAAAAEEDLPASAAAQTLPTEFLYFAWYRTLRLVADPSALDKPETFGLAVEGIAKVVDMLIAVGRPRAIKPDTQAPVITTAPDIASMLHLFLPWLLAAARRSEQGFHRGRALAAATLCKIFALRGRVPRQDDLVHFLSVGLAHLDGPLEKDAAASALVSNLHVVIPARVVDTLVPPPSLLIRLRQGLVARPPRSLLAALLPIPSVLGRALLRQWTPVRASNRRAVVAGDEESGEDDDGVPARDRSSTIPAEVDGLHAARRWLREFVEGGETQTLARLVRPLSDLVLAGPCPWTIAVFIFEYAHSHGELVHRAVDELIERLITGPIGAAAALACIVPLGDSVVDEPAKVRLFAALARVVGDANETNAAAAVDCMTRWLADCPSSLHQGDVRDVVLRAIAKSPARTEPLVAALLRLGRTRDQATIASEQEVVAGGASATVYVLGKRTLATVFPRSDIVIFRDAYGKSAWQLDAGRLSARASDGPSVSVVSRWRVAAATAVASQRPRPRVESGGTNMTMADVLARVASADTFQDVIDVPHDFVAAHRQFCRLDLSIVDDGNESETASTAATMTSSSAISSDEDDEDMEFVSVDVDDERELPALKTPFVSSRRLLAHLGCLSNAREVAELRAGAKLDRSLRMLDKMPERSTHKIGVVYVGPGQGDDQSAILANEQGSDAFRSFLASLGWNVDLVRHTGYMGGLDRRQLAGRHAPYYCDSACEVMFHAPTLMPNSASDAQQIHKKKHVGNDMVNIVWIEAERDYQPFTITSKFNHVTIMLEPVRDVPSLTRVRIHIKASERGKLGPFGPLQDNVLVSNRVLGPLVRATAVAADLAVKRTLGYRPPSELRQSLIDEMLERYELTAATPASRLWK